MYQRHTLVVTKTKFWLTIESDQPLSIITLMKECSVHLLYLSNMKFGTLRWQPCNPQPVLPKPNLGKFDIIEEYTLDEQTTSGESSTAENNVAEHVETTQQEPDQSAINTDQCVSYSVLLPGESTDQKEEEQDNVSNASLVETTVDDGSVDTLIPTKRASSTDSILSMKSKIVIPKLNDTDIDVWTNDEHTYYNFVPSHVGTDSKPEITKVRGYGLRSAEQHSATRIKEEVSHDEPTPKRLRNSHPPQSSPSPERLLAHVNALINKVSEFVTKPVDAKHNITSTELPEGKTKQQVETADESLSSPVETSESEAEPTRQCVTKIKQRCTVRCKICNRGFGSIKDLNDHHREDHWVIDCDLCDKKFETRTTLDKHKYSHKDLRFVCEDCGQSFPFKSRLDQHCIIHQDDLNYMCQCKGCTHGFKNKGDLNQHLQSHQEGWYWCDTCPYKNKDK